MGKEFIEYHSDNGKAPYSIKEVCYCLTQYVRNYIAQDRSKIANIDENVRDAVLVDAINFLGAYVGFDFGLSTKNLYDNRVEKETVDGQCLLSIVQNYYASYIFEYGIVESVLSNSHMNNCTDKFDVNDGVIVLVDFINYLSQVNDYDRIFTINDLYKKFEQQEYKAEMSKLKEFLEKTSQYSEKLIIGENIDSILDKMAISYKLKDDKYHYTYNSLNRMLPIGKQKKVEEEIYAMSYAYEKLANKIQEQPHTEIIKQKIIEMKKR